MKNFTCSAFAYFNAEFDVFDAELSFLNKQSVCIIVFNFFVHIKVLRTFYKFFKHQYTCQPFSYQHSQQLHFVREYLLKIRRNTNHSFHT